MLSDFNDEKQKYMYHDKFVNVKDLVIKAKEKYDNIISVAYLNKRLSKYNWDIDDALREKVDTSKTNAKNYFYKKEQLSIKDLYELSKNKFHIDLNKDTILMRIKKGWSVEDAISTPIKKGKNVKKESEHERLMRINGNKRWS